MDDEEFRAILLATFKEESEEMLAEWERIGLSMHSEVTVEKIEELFRIAHTLKGSAKVAGVKEIGQFIHQLEDFISKAIKDPEQRNADFQQKMIDAHQVLEKLIEGDTISNEEIAKIVSSSSKTKIDPEKNVESKVESELQTKAVSEVEPNTEPQAKPKNQVKAEPQADKSLAPKINAGGPKKTSPKKPRQAVLRVKQEKIDEIIRTVGEISNQLAVVKHYFQTEGFSKQKAMEATVYCSKYIKALQNSSLSLSLQTIERCFQTLERACRDVAKQSNKKINVIKSGEQNELDKNVLDLIADPFLHIVRNAVDHGIEEVEERIKAGKDEFGTIQLIASQTTDEVIIKIKDDGKGIDHNAVKQKAIKLGLLDPQSKATVDEIHQMILTPGFSTKQEVSTISGRGVGLDVVNTVINSLGGKLRISSELGKGSEFTIQLPLNFSLIDTVLVKINCKRYGIPLRDISEIIDIREFKIEKNEIGTRYFRLRGETVLLQDVHQYLETSTESTHQQDSAAAIINRNGTKPVAFFVDEILGKQNLYVKPLEKGLENALGVSGTSVLPDGNAGLILNLAEIVSYSQRQILGVANG